MVIRCPGCSGALKWLPQLQKLKCAHCDSLYESGEIVSPDSEKDTMVCNIFACTSCGAKLAVNDTEASTFCAYCGQPTIVFERVSKMVRPDRIIPFKVTREEAESSIRSRFKKGRFVPKSIKNFHVERISGIYVPYRVYDIEYSDNQTVEVSRKNFRKDFRCRAKTVFRNMTADVSMNFCNESSRRLEPYDFREAVEFHEGYLSGFYADRYDENRSATEERVIKRCKELFDKEVQETISEYGSKTLKKSKPKVKILRQEYVFLPVWFLTLRYKDRPYTMLTNGQTGEVIGSVPFVWAKAIAAWVALTGLFLLIFPNFYAWFFDRPMPDDSDAAYCVLMFRCAVWFIPALLAYGGGWTEMKRIKANVKRTSAKEMADYAGERQEESE